MALNGQPALTCPVALPKALSLDSLPVASPPVWVLDALTGGLRKGLREELVTYTI